MLCRFGGRFGLTGCLTASATEIVEGKDITYTVTTTDAVAEDTVVTFKVIASATGAGSNDFQAAQMTQTATILAGEKTASVTVTPLADGVPESTETFQMEATVAGVVKTVTTSIIDADSDRFVLTKDQDIKEANIFYASQIQFNVDGTGPTLQSNDILSGRAGRDDNKLIVTDLTPGVSNSNLPTGLALNNVQIVELNSTGNTAASGFSTVPFASVKLLTGNTDGTGNDTYMAANGATGAVMNITHTGSAGTVNTVGGTDVTVNMTSAANAAAVTVGRANAGTASNATGAVVVDHAGSGAVTSYGGTTQTITAGGGAVTVGDANGVATNAKGVITVTNTAQIARGNTGQAAAAATTVVGGTDVNVTTNAGPVTVGSAALPAVNPTGNVTVIDTVGTTIRTAAAEVAGIAAGAAGTAAYAAAARGVAANVVSDVTTNGGVNVSVGTSGSITVSKAAGDVVATNTDTSNASTVTVSSGEDVTVTTSGTGAVAIGGNNAATNPTGAIKVVDTSSGAVTVKGGSSVDVTAKGGVVSIGGSPTLSTTGAVTVVQNSANTVTIDGGSTVNVSSVGGNVTIGTTASGAVTTGAVTIASTYAGPSAAAFAVGKAAGAVSITTTATTGAISVGEAATLNAAGTALDKGANNSTGAVVIDNSEAAFNRAGTAITSYGTGAATVYTHGSTTVSIKGGTGAAAIVKDVNATLATGTAGAVVAGQPIAASTLATVTLNNVANTGGATLTSNALTAVNIANATSSAVTIVNNTAAHALALELTNNQEVSTLQSGVTNTVTDVKAGIVTVTTTGTVANKLALTADTATGLVFNNAAAVSLTNATSTTPLLTSINAAGSTGGVTLSLAANTAFAGGTGKSTVTVGADPTLAVTGGANTGDEYIAGYNFVSNTLVSGFETLTANAVGANVGTGFTTLKVASPVAVDFTAVSAGAALSLGSTATSAVSYTLASNTANDSMSLSLGGVTAANVTATRIENVAIVSNGTSPATNSVNIADTTLKTVTTSGARPLTFTAGDETTVKTITIGGASAAASTAAATINGVTTTSQALGVGTAAQAATALAAALNGTERVLVTWQAFTGVGTQSIGGMTVSATGAFSAAQVAQVAGGGTAIPGLTVTTQPTLWSVGGSDGTSANYFYSTTPSADVAAVVAGTFTGLASAPTTSGATNGTGGATIAVASGATVAITQAEPFSLSQAVTAGTLTASAANTASGLVTINASASTGTVTVDPASVLSVNGTTFTGGSALLTAGGVSVAKNGNPVSTVAVTGTVLATDTNKLKIVSTTADGVVHTLEFTNAATPNTPALMATALKAGILALNSDGGGSTTDYASSGVTVTDNGAGVLTVTAGAGVVLNSVTATPVAGADTITVASTTNLYAANDVYTSGSGGMTITVGQGGHANYSTQTANGADAAVVAVTPAVTYASGSETLNLAASAAAKDTVIQVSGGNARVNDFKVTTSPTTSDVLTFAAAATALPNVTSSTPMNQTIVPNLNYTASNGIITFLPTGVSKISDFTLASLVSAVQAVLSASGNAKVAAFESGGNTYVVQDPTSATVSLTTLNGVTGITGFTGKGTTSPSADGIAAQNTIVSTNLTNNANPVTVNTTSPATTTDAAGYSYQTVSGLAVAGSGVQTITNLASQATIDDASTGLLSKLATTQVGTAGGNSLVYNSTAAKTVASLTVTGAGALTVAAQAPTIITSIIDGGATNTLSTIYVTGTAAVTLNGFTDTALKTIDASAAASGFTLVDTLAGQTIKASEAGTSNITANGTGNIITQSSTGTGAVTFVGSGFADTITLSGSGNHNITASGGNATITVGTGANTINAQGSGNTITVASTSTNINTITVGPKATVTLSAAAAVDKVTLVPADVAGAKSDGEYSLTTITNALAGDTIKLVADGDFYDGNTAAGAYVNVASATTLAQALDMAAAKAVFNGAPTAGGEIAWFQYGGNTYIVDTNGADHIAAGLDTTDYVIKLTGLVSVVSEVAGLLTLG